MRKLLIAVLFALPFVALAAPPKTVTLDVQNMTCGLCPITVKKSLEKVSGVSDVQVNFDQKTATVTYDPDKAQPDPLFLAWSAVNRQTNEGNVVAPEQRVGVLSRNRRKFRQPINVACPAPGRWGRPNSRVTSRHFDHGNASRTSRPDCSGLDEAD